MKSLLTIAVLAFCSAGHASEALQTKVTLDSASALEFFKVLNVKDDARVVGDKTVHSKSVNVTTESSGNQINVRCSYIERAGKNEKASCDLGFYVNSQSPKLEE